MRVLLLVAIAGCVSSAPPKVTFSDEWPTRVAHFDAVTDGWTRTAKLRDGYEELLTVQATFKTPEWRAAHVAREVKFAQLNDAAATDLVAKEQAALADHYEVELLVTTWDRRENDLDRGERSVWRVVLVDADGHDVQPLEIVRDNRSDGVLRAEFPAFDDFSKAYIARFPKTARVLGPGVDKVGLRISSSRGGIELTWSSR